MKKTKWIFLFAVLLVSVFTGCKKDQNTITGTVKYKAALSGDIKPASNATVYLMYGHTKNLVAMKTVADDQGHYMFNPVPDGEYYVKADKSTTLIDYHGKSNNVKVKGDDVAQVDLTLGSNVNGIYGQAEIEINGEYYVSSYTKIYLAKHNTYNPIDSVNCDDDGNYYLIGIDPGSYDLFAYFAYNGYEYCDEVDNVSVLSGDFTEVNFTLTACKKNGQLKKAKLNLRPIK